MSHPGIRGSQLPEALSILGTDYVLSVVDTGGGVFKTKKIQKDLFSTGPQGPPGTPGTPGAPGAPGAEGETLMSDTWAFDTFKDYSVGASPTLNGGKGWDGNGVSVNGAIVSRSWLGSITHKRLELTGPGAFRRKMGWGNKWKKLRIGVLWRINHGATFGGSWGIGINSGTATGWLDASTPNWIGAGNNLALSGNTFTFTTGTDWDYFSNAFLNFSTKVGVTETDVGGGSGSTGRDVSSSEGLLVPFILDVARPEYASSVTYSFQLMGPHGANNSIRYSQGFGALIDFMREPVLGTSGWSAATTQSANITNSEVAGAFDSVEIVWKHNTQKLELAAVAVRKIL